jgi:mono/diheme cytochrome c family protein
MKVRFLAYGLMAAALLALPATAQAADVMAGKKVFDDNCASCHGPDGNSVVAGVPHFSKGERLEKPDSMLIKTVQTGLNVMPAWKGILTDVQMADALAYIRTLRK